jgi:DHA1 family tetracycline resistance protein-like MFS transporter
MAPLAPWRDDTRPLLIIFLTIFVNLIGFGIIIPLLPFYAETFGASPIVIGLLFAVFSLCQLVAAPALGDLSDRYGRRPILLFSLLGTVVSFVMLALAHSIVMLFLARIVDGLSGGNISTARAYVADVTEPKDRAPAYGLIGAAFGLGFIMGPALSGVLAQVSITAPIWAAAALTLVAAAMAWFWLPETVHRATAGAGNPLSYLPGLLQRPAIRRVLTVDFIYWFSFAISRRRSRCSWRGFTMRRGPGISSRVLACSARSFRGGFIRPIVGRAQATSRCSWGVICSVVGLVAAALSHSVPLFARRWFRWRSEWASPSNGVEHGRRAGRGDEQGGCRAPRVR